jgi:stage V sporulation protein SpoVS
MTHMTTLQQRDSGQQLRDYKELTVSKITNVHDLAVSISKNIQEGTPVRVIGMGANAVNQMAKGSAKARGFLAPVGIDLSWKIYFTDRHVGVGDEAEKVSAIVFESRLYN